MTTTRRFQMVLLPCGIAAALLYVAMNVVAIIQYPGYIWTAQAVSELFAIGAPSRPTWVALGTVYNALMIAFGIGIALSANGRRVLNVIGALMSISGLLGFFAPPMHTREVLAAGGGTWTDTMHIAITAALVAVMLLAMGLAAAVLGARFRLFSIVTIMVMIAFGWLTASQSSQLDANMPTPWMGVWERLSIAAYMLWLVAIALNLWSPPSKEP